MAKAKKTSKKAATKKQPTNAQMQKALSASGGRLLSFEELVGDTLTPEFKEIIKREYYDTVVDAPLTPTTLNGTYLKPTSKLFEWLHKKINDPDATNKFKEFAEDGKINALVFSHITRDEGQQYIYEVHSKEGTLEDTTLARKYDHIAADTLGIASILTTYKDPITRQEYVVNNQLANLKIPRSVSRTVGENEDVPKFEGVLALVETLKNMGTLEGTRAAAYVMLANNTAGRTGELEGQKDLSITWGKLAPDGKVQSEVVTRASKKGRDAKKDKRLQIANPEGVDIGFSLEEIQAQLDALKEAYAEEGITLQPSSALWLTKDNKIAKAADVGKSVQDFVKSTKIWHKVFDDKSEDEGHFVTRSLRKARVIQLLKSGLKPVEIIPITGHSAKDMDDMISLYGAAGGRAEGVSGNPLLYQARRIKSKEEQAEDAGATAGITKDKEKFDLAAAVREAAEKKKEEEKSLTDTIVENIAEVTEGIGDWFESMGLMVDREYDPEVGFEPLLESPFDLWGIGSRRVPGVKAPFTSGAAPQIENKPGVRMGQVPSDAAKVPATPFGEPGTGKYSRVEPPTARSAFQQPPSSRPPIKPPGPPSLPPTASAPPPGGVPAVVPPLPYKKPLPRFTLGPVETALQTAKRRVLGWVGNALKVGGPVGTAAAIGLYPSEAGGSAAPGSTEQIIQSQPNANWNSPRFRQMIGSLAENMLSSAVAIPAVKRVTDNQKSIYEPRFVEAAYTNGHITLDEARDYFENGNLAPILGKVAKTADLPSLFKSAFEDENPIAADIASALLLSQINQGAEEGSEERTNDFLDNLISKEFFEEEDFHTISNAINGSWMNNIQDAQYELQDYLENDAIGDFGSTTLSEEPGEPLVGFEDVGDPGEEVVETSEPPPPPPILKAAVVDDRKPIQGGGPGGGDLQFEERPSPKPIARPSPETADTAVTDEVERVEPRKMPKTSKEEWEVRALKRRAAQKARITRLQPKPLDVEQEQIMDKAFAEGTPSQEYNKGFADYGKYAAGP